MGFDSIEINLVFVVVVDFVVALVVIVIVVVAVIVVVVTLFGVTDHIIFSCGQ